MRRLFFLFPFRLKIKMRGGNMKGERFCCPLRSLVIDALISYSSGGLFWPRWIKEKVIFYLILRRFFFLFFVIFVSPKFVIFIHIIDFMVTFQIRHCFDSYFFTFFSFKFFFLDLKKKKIFDGRKLWGKVYLYRYIK